MSGSLELMETNGTGEINGTMGNLTSENCELKDYTIIQFYLVVVAGGWIGLISVVFNLFLLRLLLHNTNLRHSCFFLIALAFFDIFIAILYLALFTTKTFSEYFNLVELHIIWHRYSIVVLAISQAAKLASTCLILFASLERLKGTKEVTSFPFSLYQKFLLVALSVFIGAFINWTVIMEYRVVTQEECAGNLFYLDLYPSELINNWWYRVIWTFWIRNIFMVFFPFFALFYMNAMIMIALKRQMEEFHEALIFPDFARDLANERAGRIVAATKMLVAVSGSYLIANVVNVLITVWEHIDPGSLEDELDAFLYLCADVVSLLTLLSTALRLPVYYWCNNDVRMEFWKSIGLGRQEISHQPREDARRKSGGEGKRRSLRKDGTSQSARIELAPESRLDTRNSVERRDTLVLSSKHGQVLIQSYSPDTPGENGTAL